MALGFRESPKLLNHQTSSRSSLLWNVSHSSSGDGPNYTKGMDNVLSFQTLLYTSIEVTVNKKHFVCGKWNPLLIKTL